MDEGGLGTCRPPENRERCFSRKIESSLISYFRFKSPFAVIILITLYFCFKMALVGLLRSKLRKVSIQI